MNFPTPRLNKIFEPFKPIKGIISIWGDFGVGKTIFALQTALNDAKRKKRILYIYTKPNFPYEIIRKIIKKDLNKILNNIIFIQTTNFYELNTVIFNLEFLILNNLTKKNRSLNLIVVDSITDLYRLELNKEKKNKNIQLNYQLSQILANLAFLNNSYGIEVLVVNELNRKNQLGQTLEVQSGGKVVKYWIRYDIKIARTEKLNERNFILREQAEKKIFEFISSLTERGFE